MALQVLFSWVLRAVEWHVISQRIGHRPIKPERPCRPPERLRRIHQWPSSFSVYQNDREGILKCRCYHQPWSFLSGRWELRVYISSKFLVCVYVLLCTYVHMYVCTCSCVYSFVYVHLCVWVYVRVHACVWRSEVAI